MNTESLFNAFVYSFTKPSMAKTLASQFCEEEFPLLAIEQKVLYLGALLSVGRLAEFKKLTGQTDFQPISFEHRAALAALLFTSFNKFLIGRETNAIVTEGLLSFSRALLPAIMIPTEPANADTGPRPENGLITLEYARHIDPHKKGVVFFREFFMGPGSRKHEFGQRVQKALASQGWQVALRHGVAMEEFAGSDYDFAVMDIAVLNAVHKQGLSAADLLARVRTRFRKIMVIEPDPWCPEHNGLLIDLIDQIDFVWGLTADWPILADPRFAAKAFFFPNVSGFDHLTALHDAMGPWDRCTFSFVGSLGIVNLPRLYWVLESLYRKLPVDYHITDPSRDDGLGQEESLARYAELLASTHVAINYVNRLDGANILTGRALEVISLKRLLLQERCTAMDAYFVEGEHFLEFSSMETFINALDFIAGHPRTAHLIACQAHQFYQEHYSSKRFVEHFQYHLDA